MITGDELRQWPGREVYDEGHEKIGEISAIYVDTATGEPEWLAVKTGLFGMKLSFVPIAGASEMEDHVMVPHTKDEVKDAPNVEADGELTQEEERRLYEHYGVEWGNYPAEPVARGTSGPDTDRPMTRSEEEIAVGTRRRETGRARLRKYVVTEEVEQRVPVSREEVRIEREPITDANVDEALEGPALKEDEHEVTLYAEEPVVEKRVVPKERVRLAKEQEVDEETVADEVRREEIEAEGDVGR